MAMIKIPWTHARANAYMCYNELFGRSKKHIKRQARKEERRWLKQELRKGV